MKIRLPRVHCSAIRVELEYPARVAVEVEPERLVRDRLGLETGDRLWLAANPHFVFESRGVLRQALDGYAAGKGNSSDYLLGAKAQARQARAIYTFDKALRSAEGFVVLEPRRRWMNRAAGLIDVTARTPKT